MLIKVFAFLVERNCRRIGNCIYCKTIFKFKFLVLAGGLRFLIPETLFTVVGLWVTRTLLAALSPIDPLEPSGNQFPLQTMLFLRKYNIQEGSNWLIV